MRELARSLFDPLLAAGGGDLVAGLAVPVSVGTLAAFMDLPGEDREQWVAWVRLMYDSRDAADARAATGAYYAYIDDLVAAERGAFVRMLLDSEVDGERLDARRRGALHASPADRRARDDGGRPGFRPTPPRIASGRSHPPARRAGTDPARGRGVPQARLASDAPGAQRNT